MALRRFKTVLVLPSTYAGIVAELRAQPRNDDDGVAVGAEIGAANFRETGGGEYVFWADIDDSADYITFRRNDTGEHLASDTIDFAASGGGTAPTLAEIDAYLTAAHGAGNWTGNVIYAAAPITTTPIPIDELDLDARRSETFVAPPLVATGLDSTGWTQFVFTVKRSIVTDSDDEAIIAIRISNPGAGGDGLRVLNGRPALVAAYGSLNVLGINPDTSVQPWLDARAMNLPPSPDGSPYRWELKRYKAAGEVFTVGEGNFPLAESVRRSAVGA